MRGSPWVLTVHTDFDPLGYTGRDSVGGDAQIGPHVQARDARQFQRLTFPLEHWTGGENRG